MVVAQRGETLPSYTFDSFAVAAGSRIYRFSLKTPQDPPSPGLWYPVPAEYAVGFAGDHQNTTGGLDLGYGYNRKGEIDLRACESSLWATGENLRNDPVLKSSLEPGGPLIISGVQGMPAGPVKPQNDPPWSTYMVDVLERAVPDPYPGEMGDVAVYRKPCGAPVLAQWFSPRPVRTFYAGPESGYPYGPGYTWDPPVTWDPPPTCLVPGQCPPPPPPPMCLAAASGEPVCDTLTGEWVLSLDIAGQGPFNAVRTSTSTIGVSVSGGALAPLTRPFVVRLNGLAPGKIATVEMCGFDAAAAASGRPYDCCKATITVVTPPDICQKQ